MAEQAPSLRSYPKWVRASILVTGLLLLATVLAAGYGWWRLGIDRPVSYSGEEDHFKYGSLGGERGYMLQLGFGLPYWIWVAMPELFAEHLPSGAAGHGYAGFGYLYEPGKNPRFDLPIGTSRRNVMGIDRVWLTCASCHTGSVRESRESPPAFVLGMPANRYNQGAWAKFLFDAARDEKFSGERMLLEIGELAKERRRLVKEGKLQGDLPAELSLVDRVAFRFLVVPIMRKRLLEIGDRLSDFTDPREWGPGRVDTWNSPKALLHFPAERLAPEELHGPADFPSVWNQAARCGMQLHWDGNNTSVDERNLSASFAATIPPTLDKCNLLRTKRYLATAAPPPFPASRIDRALASRGELLYRQYCASCHGAKEPPFKRPGYGERVGTVVPIEIVATDRRHFDSYTLALSQAQNSLYSGYPLPDSEACPNEPEAKICPEDPFSKDYPARFSHFKKTSGYANSPLDGLWLRAPYLHNGSVPTLRDLLNPAAERPPAFYIGYDVYDYADVGFVTSGPEAEKEGWRYDTTLLGNGNSGHEGTEYGTALNPEEKNALLEYLKTF